MPLSLSSKLRDLRRRGLKTKNNKPGTLFDSDHIKTIARHMPRTEGELRKLIPESVMLAYGECIIEVTKAHNRDQGVFEDCVGEINAFTRGGLPGMAVLDRVYKNILKQYGMVDDMEEVFDACKIYLHTDQNRLKRKRNADEEGVESENSSQI